VTREQLHKLGVPDAAIDTVLDAWMREIYDQAAKLTARELQTVVANLPKAQGAAVHAELIALTPESAARKAHCSRRTVDRAIEAGQIRAAKGSTGLVVIDRESFEAWRNSRTPDVSAVLPRCLTIRRGLRVAFRPDVRAP
jgi:hypothetical protein